MKAVILVLACGMLQVALAGRAFPVESENYVTSLFQRINPSIEWDPKNFLVDLSGLYAQCKLIGQSGSVGVKRKTPQKESIGALVDTTTGSGTDVESVNGYLKATLARWPSNAVFRKQILKAKKFGCSVQPGCRGQVSIGCLFSPGANNNGQEEEEGKQKALAFTKAQYSVAERHTGTKWDRSHFIENLSGFETDCAMISKKDWTFANAIAKAKKLGMTVTGLYGASANKGSTPAAIKRILHGWKQIPAKQVGCSVIPDCKTDRGLVVVVSCLFRE